MWIAALPLVFETGPARRLAVDRDQPLLTVVGGLRSMCDPILKAPLEGLRLQGHQQPTNAIA